MERRARKFKKNMTTALNGIAIATAGVGAAFGGAAKMSANFEEAMADVEKVTDAKTMKEMKEEIEDMANVIPMAHQELAQLARDAGRMGVQGAEALSAFTESVAKMSFATSLSADRAGKALGRLTKWLNIPAKYAENLGAAINELSNNLPADADEIVRTLGKTGQQFEILGAATQTTLALSASISGLADSAERGGTRMRRLIQQLQEPSTIRDVAEAINMNKDALKDLIEESPRDAIRLLAETMAEGGAKADQMREVLATTSRSTLTLLANNLDVLNDALERTGEQLENPTSMIREFQISIGTTNAQLKLLWQNIKNVLMNALGDQANNAVKEVIKWLREWVLTIENIIDNNKELRQSIQTVLKAILEIGATITVFRLVASAFVALMSPVTALTAAVFTLGAAWRYNAFGIRDFLKESAIKSFEQMGDAIQGIVEGIGNLVEKGKKEISLDIKFGPWAVDDDGGKSQLKKNLEEMFGTGKDGELADRIEGGMKLAFGVATWDMTGSALVGTLAATLVFDWTVEPFFAWLTNKWREKSWDTFGEAFDVELLGWDEFLDTFPDWDWKEIINPINWINFITPVDTSYFDDLIDFPGWKKMINPITWINILTPIDTSYFEDIIEFPGWGTFIDEVFSVDIKFNPIVDKWNKFREWWNDLPITGGFSRLPEIPALPGNLEEKQKGGFIPGSGSGDIIPAMLEPGEFVWPKEMVSKFPGLIQGMWQGFKKGGPVSAGKHYYGPGEDSGPDWLKRLRNLRDNPPFSIPDPKSLERWEKEIGALITVFEELWGTVRNSEARFESLEQELESFEDDLGGVTKELNILGLSLGDLSDIIDKMGVKDVGSIGDMWKAITTRPLTQEEKRFNMARGVAGDESEQIKRPERIPSVELLSTVADFEDGLQGVVDKIVELEEVADKYGIESEFLTGDLERLRSNLKESGFDIEEFDEMLEEARGSGEEASEALFDFSKRLKDTTDSLKAQIQKLSSVGLDVEGFSEGFAEKLTELNVGLEGAQEIIGIAETFQDYTGEIPEALREKINEIKETNLGGMLSDEGVDKLVNSLKEGSEDVKTALGELLATFNMGEDELAKAMGITVNTLGNLQSAVSTITSGFMEVAQATGEMSAGQSARIGGITSAAQSALSGNWLQAAMDLFTGFMTGWIEDLKAKREELQQKLDATFSIVLDGLEGFSQEITSLTNELAGPFGSAISGALDGFTGFYKMTQQFVQDDIIGMVQTGFSALMSVVTGITSSFIGLLQRSSQWEALQAELNPIWDALAEAFGTLLTPVVALARWLREYLGISKDVGEDMEEIANLNVPSGFKRARKVWEAAEPGQPVGTAGGGGGMAIPDWAKQIIRPIKDKLIPYLKGSKDFLGLIETWAKNAWKWIQKLILEWIPRFFSILNKVREWIANIDWGTIFGYVGDALKWFAENFPDAWELFTKKIDAFLKGTFGEDGFLREIEKIRKTLQAIAKSMGVAVGGIGGAAVGATIGGAVGGAVGGPVGGPVGALIGGGIGAVAGGIAGFLGFQEGGVVTKPVPGIVGEAGPEAVIPLDRLGDFGMGNVEVTINASGDGVADQIIDDIQVKNKRLTGSRSTSAAINRRTYS